MSKLIAIVANSTWNIYNFRLNIIKKLLDEGWRVIVVAPLDEYIKYKELYPTVKHIPLHNLQRDGKSPINDLKLIFELKTIYQRLKPELILHYTHKPNIFGGIAAKLAGIESIAVITGLGYAFLHKGLTNTITKQLYRFIKSYHRTFIFENEDDRQFFIDEKILTQDKSIAVNGCGVDIFHYKPSPNGQINVKTIFTFLGRLLYDKGIVEFVEAAKLVKKKNANVEFWVVGELDDGNPSMVKTQDLLQWIDEGSIVYHGFVKDIKPIVAKSDCIVLPSYREGMPRIVLEGMAMAKPIITTRTAGCRQTIDEGINGYLVKVGDVPDLSMAMEKFLSLSYEKAHIMGQSGRKMAEEQFNSEKIAQDLFDIVDQ